MEEIRGEIRKIVGQVYSEGYTDALRRVETDIFYIEARVNQIVEIPAIKEVVKEQEWEEWQKARDK